MEDFRLDGKIALVTGASYGIGFNIACGFAEAGATVVFNDIKQENIRLKFQLNILDLDMKKIKLRSLYKGYWYLCVNIWIWS